MANTYTINNIANNGNVTGSITAGGFAGSGAGNITLTGAGAGILTGAGVAGQIFTTSSSNGTNWATGVTHNPLDPMIVMNPSKTTLEVKGNLVINGVDLEERLKTIEKVLTIPERDVKLEAKHPKLKKMYDEYINALGKYRTFEAIKGDDDGTT